MWDAGVRYVSKEVVMIRAAVFLLILGACRADPTIKIEQVEVSDPSPTDTGTGAVVVPPDTAEPEPEPEEGPSGVWSDCRGTLTLTGESYTWQTVTGSCSVSEYTSYTDGTLTMPVGDLSACEDPPWWLMTFGDDTPSFSVAQAGTRLTLVPQVAVASGRVAQFETVLDVEEWLLTSDEGDTSLFRICEADGAFFGGDYRTTDESCNFLSCGGRITAVTISDRGEAWSTGCGGDCPCAGVVSVSSRTEEALEGEFFGTNCARVFEGTFTGVPASR